MADIEEVEPVASLVGEWSAVQAIALEHLMQSATQIDIVVAYRIWRGIGNALDEFRRQRSRRLRVIFGNMWDNELVAAYQRKYFDRTARRIQGTVRESIGRLIGECSVRKLPGQDLTEQRITFSLYRVDDAAIFVPLDMKKQQDPAPLAWILSRESAPRAFDHYVREYEQVFEEAQLVYASTPDACGDS